MVLGRWLAGCMSGITWHQVLVSPCSVRVVPPILELSYKASIIPILNVIHHTLMEFQPSAKLGGINYKLNYGSLSPNGASAQSGRQWTSLGRQGNVDWWHLMLEALAIPLLHKPSWMLSTHLDKDVPWPLLSAPMQSEFTLEDLSHLVLFHQEEHLTFGANTTTTLS